MAVKTDMLKGKNTIILILVGVATVFLTLLFMYMNSGYANAIDLTLAQPVLIGQLLLLAIVIGTICIAGLWFSLYLITVTLKIRLDIAEIKGTVESMASEMAKEKAPEPEKK